MDVGRFDELTRMLAASGSRRSSLRALAGAALAGGLSRLGRREAVAACKKARKRCKKNKDCCSKKCRRKKKNGKKKCRGNGPGPTCLENGAMCASSNTCCSGFCGDNPVPWASTCCVPNDETCVIGSDCCQNAASPAACESGRCCVGEGGTCATPNGFQNAECCAGLGCDAEFTHKCLPA